MWTAGLCTVDSSGLINNVSFWKGFMNQCNYIWSYYFFTYYRSFSKFLSMDRSENSGKATATDGTVSEKKKLVRLALTLGALLKCCKHFQPDYTEKRVWLQHKKSSFQKERVFTELNIEPPSSAFQQRLSVCHFVLL